MSHSDSRTIQPIGRFEATLRLPGSKSLTNRTLLLAALAEGVSNLSNVLFADDTRVMLDALQQLGFKLEIDEANTSVRVHGQGGRIPNPNAELFLGNAGTATRFLTAVLCLGQGTYTIDGIVRMRQRPIGQLVSPLRDLGGSIQYINEEGFPPLRIDADGLRGGAITLKPTLSSQFISALMQAAPYMTNGLDLHFDGPVTSLPYVQMTARLIERFGVKVTMVGDGEGMLIMPSGYGSRNEHIEPDASNASYFLAAAAIVEGASVTIESLGSSSLQGDVGFAHVLGQMGADVQVGEGRIVVRGCERLRAVDVDLNHMPDMAQTLAVVALFAEGRTVMRNIGNLRVKETDRLEALRLELTKLGAQVHVTGDDLQVEMETPGKLSPARIETYDDHRMAMAFAVAGLRCEGVTILDPSCVNKTFPDFWTTLDQLRANSL